MATLAQTVVDGKARTVGLSNVPAWYAIAASMLADRHGWAAPVALQLEYSLLERTAEIEHVPAAQHCRMSLVPWSRWPTVPHRQVPADSRHPLRRSSAPAAAGSLPPRAIPTSALTPTETGQYRPRRGDHPRVQLRPDRAGLDPAPTRCRDHPHRRHQHRAAPHQPGRRSTRPAGRRPAHSRQHQPAARELAVPAVPTGGELSAGTPRP